MKKFLAVLLVVLLVVSVMPTAAMAETEPPVEPTPVGGNLLISKTAEGIEKEDMPAEIKISLQYMERIQTGEDENGEAILEWKARYDPIIVPLKLNGSGEYESAIITVGGVYEVKELGAEVEGYKLNTVYSGLATENVPAEGNFIDVRADEPVVLAITNHYQSIYGTLTLKKTFEGLPEDKIPASIKWSIYNDDTNEFVQDVILSAAEGWTKSITLPEGEYRLVEDVAGSEVAGYNHSYYGVRWATVGRGEETVENIVNEYTKESILSISVPVEVQVKQTGKNAPATDKTFDFNFSVTSRNSDAVTADFNGAAVTDKFSMTVKAGESSASGTLTLTGPASQIYGLVGELSQSIPTGDAKWTYDTAKYTFGTDATAPQSAADGEEGGAEKMPVYIDKDDASVDSALFVNEYKSVEATVTVNKTWNDKDHESKRPESVTVQLGYFEKDAEGKDTETFVPYLVDGKKVTAVLNEKNNWKCSFDGLDTALTWTVIELDVPSGYYFYTTRSDGGKSISLVNVYYGDQKPQTGDSLMLWAVLAAVSCAAACSVIFVTKKRSKG